MPGARPEAADDPGGSVTAIAGLVSAADRQRLEVRLAELRAVEALVREIPAQRPPDVPPTLAAISAIATERTGS